MKSNRSSVSFRSIVQLSPLISFALANVLVCGLTSQAEAQSAQYRTTVGPTGSRSAVGFSPNYYELQGIQRYLESGNDAGLQIHSNTLDQRLKNSELIPLDPSLFHFLNVGTDKAKVNQVVEPGQMTFFAMSPNPGLAPGNPRRSVLQFSRVQGFPEAVNRSIAKNEQNYNELGFVAVTQRPIEKQQSAGEMITAYSGQVDFNGWLSSELRCSYANDRKAKDPECVYADNETCGAVREKAKKLTTKFDPSFANVAKRCEGGSIKSAECTALVPALQNLLKFDFEKSAQAEVQRERHLERIRAVAKLEPFQALSYPPKKFASLDDLTDNGTFTSQVRRFSLTNEEFESELKSLKLSDAQKVARFAKTVDRCLNWELSNNRVTDVSQQKEGQSPKRQRGPTTK